MSIINSMEAQEVFITHQMPTGTAFGVRVDNGEKVFINSKLSKKHAIAEEEVRMLIIIPNTKIETPWQAIGVSGDPTSLNKFVSNRRKEGYKI